MSNKTIIELDNEDAELFLLYRKHQNAFKTLLDVGLFDLRNGQATLNFDPNGALVEVGFNFVSYKRGRPIVQSIHLST